MIDRSELIEAALESFPEGLALLDREGKVNFWNQAAENITGFPSIETVTRTIPAYLEPLLLKRLPECGEDRTLYRSERGVLIHTQHRCGRDLPLVMRTQLLRDSLGGRIGSAVIFHLAESLDTLPHGESCEESNLEAAQAEIEEQAKSAFDEFTARGMPLGLLWITVDQAHELRKTHGSRACDTMIERVERTLTNGLRPAEELGRWGDDEFMVLSHEPSASSLAAHAQVLAGLARTSDFRWWGDRLSLTVSIGAAQAVEMESLPQLFERAQAAMLASVHEGGNHITLAPERSACSPS
ncbi:MAG TPA: diguanylate cyclase [Terracidiphilus sp.]|jgi:diguanylate cyclase (GGDEF)-like protein/PAS domain S-box-containing protein|nr:diguanylate cyclase [Terracidiphilus sp.]